MTSQLPRRFLLSLLLVILVLAGFLMSCRAAITRPAVFPAPRYRIKPQLPKGELIAVPGVAASGERTAYGYYAPGGKRLVVFFHGNGEVMGSMQDLAEFMQGAGFSVLMAEYPGYGYAYKFKASEENIYEDVSRLLQHMHSQYGYSSAEVVLWGFSLGTGVAVEMAARGLGSRVVLMAPFTSIRDTAAHHLFFGVRWLIVDRFDNKEKAPSIQLPVLIAHGEVDRVIPFRMGKELAGIFPHAEFIPVANADHNDFFMHFDDELWKKIVQFAGAP